MSLEEGRISGRELMVMVIGFTLGSSLLFVPGKVGGHDGWITVLSGLAEGLIMASIFTTLAQRFPGSSPIEYNDLIYGPYLGKIVSSMLIFFLLFVGSQVIRNFVNYFASEFMEETPTIVLAALITLSCAVAVRGGIEVLGRCSLVIVPILLFAKLFDFLLLYREMDFSFLSPIFELSLTDFFKITHSTAIFPFSESLAFIMAIPFLNRMAKARRSVLLGLVFSGLLLTLIAVRDIAVLGPLYFLSVYPSHLAIEQINLADTISRIEIIIAVDFLYMGFIKIAMLLYGASLGTAQLFGLRDYRPVVFPLGIIMIAFSFSNFDSLIENIQFNQDIMPLAALPFVLIIPLLSLIIAKIRGLPKGG